MTQRKKIIPAKVWLLLKLLLAGCALWFIYYKISSHENSHDYLKQIGFAVRQPKSIVLFFIVILMMMANWTTEAWKWKLMVFKIERISIGRAIEAIFSGITVSFFTPNRIGEYAGRVFHLHEGKRMKATFVTIIENFSQLLVTIITGTIATIIFLKTNIVLSNWLTFSIIIMLISVSVFLLFLYFNLGLFEQILLRLKFSEYWNHAFHVFSLYTSRELVNVLMLSFLRYLIFSLQFFLLLKLFGSTLLLFPSLVMSAMTFFIVTVVPTFTITEIGIRGAVSAYFFGKLTSDVLPVLNAVFSLWLINLALPAIIGSIFIFNFRFEKTER